MAFRLFAASAATGFGCGVGSLWRRVAAADSDAAATSSPATTQQQLDALDTPASVEPVKLVIVGGGYAGARTAYQLDSVYNITLIDTKNYYEATDELTSVINGPDDRVAERLEDLHALHRFYLKRARVITNRAVDVDEEHVILADGRRVPYDLLVLAPGEKRPYPFAATARTADVRAAEIKAYRTLLHRKDMHRIAVIGGGPRGCSFASTLSSICPDKDIHLFHSTGTLTPHFPYETRNRMEHTLDFNPCVTVHHNSVVTGVRYTNQPSAAVDSIHYVQRKWWHKIAGFFGRGPKQTTQERQEQLLDETSDAIEQRKAADPAAEKKRLSRHAKAAPAAASADGSLALEVDYEAMSAESESPYLDAKFSLDVSLREDTKKEVPSVLFQVYEGDNPKHTVERGKEIGTETVDDFDMVINCTGNIPNGAAFTNSEFLGPHLDHNGRFVVSKFCQLYGGPHMFCVGRSSSIDWVRSMGASDYQARVLFRNLLSVANLADNKAPNWMPTMSPVSQKSLTFPRLIVPMDELQALGSTAWTGSVTGPYAQKELTQDRQYFLAEMHKPVFYKTLDTAKVRRSVDGWMASAATDP
eukprot:CAMPEP_0174864254 /NCGR_PEP_ID=MMETSP1114-20130205/58012_1 /TAXON_ID=312471 /ORGANISM="Neobodo designis, Strain CCAP 1951/1" /LENGTH=585 /DNA_ID=CAMNT_0016099343 /DNA_START=109 /DNA_END=1863 /DNA_ORIENTATION=+